MKQVGYILILGVISLLCIFAVFRFKSSPQNIIDSAKKLYLEKKTAGLDIGNGPCLSNYIEPDWVADIAHNPRQPIDDLPENQCSSFREGKAHHFVELDLNGNLIRVY